MEAEYAYTSVKMKWKYFLLFGMVIAMSVSVNAPVFESVSKLRPINTSAELKGENIVLDTPEITCNFTKPSMQKSGITSKLDNISLITSHKGKYTFDFDLRNYNIKTIQPASVFYNITCDRDFEVREDKIRYDDKAILLSSVNMSITLSKPIRTITNSVGVELIANNWSSWERIIDPSVVTTNMTMFIPCNETGGLKCVDRTTGYLSNITWEHDGHASFLNDSGIFRLHVNSTDGFSPRDISNSDETKWASGSSFSECNVIHTFKNSNSADDYFIIRTGDGGNTQFDFYIGNRQNFSFKNSGAGNDLLDYYKVSNNSLLHTCMVCKNGVDCSFYVNATLQKVIGRGTLEGYDGNFHIMGQDDGSKFTNGTFGNFRFWMNYTLTASEVIDVFNTDLNISAGTPADTTSPVISSLTNTTTTNQSVYITWTTDEPANESNNTMGVYPNFVGVWSSLNTTLSTSHSLFIANLSNGTRYNFNTTAYDSSGNFASANFSFVTALNAPVGGTCTCPVSGNWEINDGSICELNSGDNCDLGSNCIHVNNGGFRNNGGTFRAGCCFVAENQIWYGGSNTYCGG